ncbi:PQQ-dependent sugar dehydrogenase [Mesonia sp.]|uniref:PQQ-dependent sugar dehydrogenase n=1 Tax=Mesonia sp. TaxID=1960830 RepID=UPI003F9C0005
MKKYCCLFFITFAFGWLSAQEDINIQSIATGFNAPVNIQNAGDNRLFIVEQGGIIKILNANGSTHTNPFLDISSQISSSGERGLLGLAFHPDYQNNRLFYVYYTNPSGDSVLSQFETSATDPDAAIPASENVIRVISQPASNHNGGCIAFGNDGFLYVATGDGGGGGDPNNNAQNLNSLLGKLLRFDVDNGSPYIPTNNPYANDSNALDEIYAYGLRNPWKFSFDQETGDIWIADVGQNEFEEINKSASAEAINYGWRCYEASADYDTSNCATQNTMEFPFAEYSHTNSGVNKCSITGGDVYRGSEFSNLIGKYIFADYCSNEIGSVDANGNITYFGPFPGNNFSTFGVDQDANLYVAGINSGVIYKIVDDNLSVNLESKVKLKIYPNPTQATLTIESPEVVKRIEVISFSGQLVKTFYPNQKKAKLNIRFAAGSYFIKSTSVSGHQYINQFIVQ